MKVQRISNRDSKDEATSTNHKWNIERMEWPQVTLLKLPFSCDLMEEELLSYYVTSKFTLYDRIGDPIEHLYHFWQVTTLN